MSERNAHGYGLPRNHFRIFCPELGIHAALFVAGTWAMSWLYLNAGIISVALLVYLTVALLWPEKF
ncbi:MAG TPA: K(+)-transporting ATPase subunit F [Tepidisphaeraceae bacterium]|jgi:K+-transporting ATPase KdpF subunit